MPRKTRKDFRQMYGLPKWEQPRHRMPGWLKSWQEEYWQIREQKEKEYKEKIAQKKRETRKKNQQRKNNGNNQN